ncbi:MAG TPA: hypothetical protein VHK63_01175 [Candidatus Limnocylindria bacterium]|nr:hypothetical protein [Candidatus Limnocylindria bacterium]
MQRQLEVITVTYRAEQHRGRYLDGFRERAAKLLDELEAVAQGDSEVLAQIGAVRDEVLR